MYKNLIENFKDWKLPKILGGEVISSCEESFLFLLPHIIKSMLGVRCRIVVLKGIEDLEGLESSLQRNSRLKVGEKLVEGTFENLEMKRVSRVWEKGEYSILGDLIILWPTSSDTPIRISMFDSEIEDISIIDSDSRQSIGKVNEVEISNNLNALYTVEPFEASEIELYYIKGASSGQLQVNINHPIVSLDIRRVPTFDFTDPKMSWSTVLSVYSKQGYRLIYLKREGEKDLDELEKLFDAVIPINYEYVMHGFMVHNPKLLVISSSDLLGEVDLSEKNSLSNITGEDIFKKFIIGDYIVHEDHGIGIFKGLVENNEVEYIEITYAGKDRLLVPVKQYVKLSKFVGAGKQTPALTGLNSGVWKRIKRGVEYDIMEIAKELVQLSALRTVTKVTPIIDDYRKEKEYWDFVKSFEFDDTEDQYVISNQILEDMKSEKPMDRLVVGDVGFGKTELAFRTIFSVINSGKQALLLAPTTILSHQHYRLANKRFEKYPFNIVELSRLVSGKEKESAIAGLKSGTIDLVIGTHSLLQDTVEFKELGLIVVDEEQRFGVKQKEHLKRKRAQTHILSLTATPIPRTLNLALSGVRDMSILASVPKDRLPIKNVFREFRWDDVVNAVQSEKERGGQIYYLHNRIHDLNDIKEKIESLIPEIKVSVVYGQMSRGKLNQIMNDFIDGKSDILLSTTIIENGLDLPNVNTLIVDDVFRYGLSQLYQIRGRIGRSDRQAYAHFLYNSLPGKTELRLDALREADSLGAGFLLSNRDLEIRGAGNILGKEQSGVINSVGYGLYSKMLREAVDNLKGK